MIIIRLMTNSENSSVNEVTPQPELTAPVNQEQQPQNKTSGAMPQLIKIIIGASLVGISTIANSFSIVSMVGEATSKSGMWANDGSGIFMPVFLAVMSALHLFPCLTAAILFWLTREKATHVDSATGRPVYSDEQFATIKTVNKYRLIIGIIGLAALPVISILTLTGAVVAHGTKGADVFGVLAVATLPVWASVASAILLASYQHTQHDDIARVKRVNKWRLILGIVCLSAPVASIALALVNIFVSSSRYASTSNFASYIIPAMGFIGVMTLVPGIITGIFLLISRRNG